MRTRSYGWLLAAAAIFSVVQISSSGSPQGTASTPMKYDPQQVGLLSRASLLSGKPVLDQNGAKIGRFEDLLIDLTSGRILGCTVATGDKGVVVVPPVSFLPAGEGHIVFTGQPASLRSARSLPLGSAQTAFDALTISEAYQHFGQPLAELPRSLRLVTASSLLKKPVLSEDNQPLGTILDVVADVSRGQAPYLLVKPAGEGADLYAIPPAGFDRTHTGTTLVVNAARDRFLAGPRVPAKFWTELSTPDFASRVFTYYSNPASSVVATGNAPLQPLSPTGRSDQDLREAFLGEMVTSDAGLSAARMKDLRIEVAQGRIVLSGTVPSEAAKRELLSAASRVAGAGKVENNLTVR